MNNIKSTLEIFGIVILLGIFILKKKVENKLCENDCWFFKILSFILILILILISYYYLNFLNAIRATECLKNYIQIKNIKQQPLSLLKPYLLEKPFNEFFISTSHNTYLPCEQNGDVASVDSIVSALKMGARVIELDVFPKNNLGNLPDDWEPVVVHGLELDSGNIFTTSYVNFSDCVKAINEFSETTSDPIWLEIELNTNKNFQTQKRIREILLENFQTKLLNSEYKIGTKQKHFSQVPIGNLLNKIIITTSNNKNSITQQLIDIFDGYAGDGYYINNSSNIKPSNINKQNKIYRVFPPGDIRGHFSLNYNPKPFWTNSIQLVALNFQNLDKHLEENIQMFSTCSFVHLSELKAN